MAKHDNHLECRLYSLTWRKMRNGSVQESNGLCANKQKKKIQEPLLPISRLHILLLKEYLICILRVKKYLFLTLRSLGGNFISWQNWYQEDTCSNRVQTGIIFRLLFCSYFHYKSPARKVLYLKDNNDNIDKNIMIWKLV